MDEFCPCRADEHKRLSGGETMSGLIIDCFAGGGGASVGIEMALGRPVDIAINHDPQASDRGYI